MLQNRYQTDLPEAGCDEAGRGCYAGPVFAAAVILPENFHHPCLDDSKKVPEPVRRELRIYIENHAVSFGVAMVNNNEIDRINILKASFLAMHHAIDSLREKPGFLVIDGNRFAQFKQIPFACIVKGDGIYSSIAAASILAKTYRDEFMIKLHEEYPQYGWFNNKGYGTAQHRIAIEQHGLCKYHRRSFNILPQQVNIF